MCVNCSQSPTPGGCTQLPSHFEQAVIATSGPACLLLWSLAQLLLQFGRKQPSLCYSVGALLPPLLAVRAASSGVFCAPRGTASSIQLTAVPCPAMCSQHTCTTISLHAMHAKQRLHLQWQRTAAIWSACVVAGCKHNCCAHNQQQPTNNMMKERLTISNRMPHTTATETASTHRQQAHTDTPTPCPNLCSGSTQHKKAGHQQQQGLAASRLQLALPRSRNFAGPPLATGVYLCWPSAKDRTLDIYIPSIHTYRSIWVRVYQGAPKPWALNHTHPCTPASRWPTTPHTNTGSGWDVT